MSDYVQLDLVDNVKQLDPNAVSSTVVDFPSELNARAGIFSTILMTAGVADAIPAWGYANVLARDSELRKFYPTEPMLSSALGAAVARDSTFEWSIVPTDPTGPTYKNTVRHMTEMLENADFGRGWTYFLGKVLTDLFSQDNGAFIELIRSEDRPDAPVLAIGQLDAARCERTGNPYVPVIYTNRNGKRYPLKWYQVKPLSEMPSPQEEMYGIQLCSVSRCLLAAQILRDIHIYKREKVSGNFTRAIHFASGVNRREIEDALALQREELRNLGLYRYSQPLIVSGIDPSHPVKVETINLASLPDAFDEEASMKWYVAQLALAFGVDYQEFAPLPGGNLGSASQAEIQHMKARGKGPALVMAVIENAINNSGILPKTVKFKFKEHDIQAESKRAETAFTRSKERSMRLNSFELDPIAALELAIAAGDIPEYVAEGVKKRGLAQQMYMLKLRKPQTSANQTLGGIQSQDDRNGNIR